MKKTRHGLKSFCGAAAFGILALCVMPPSRAQASVLSISVYTALAPNAYGSPNYTDWQTNAISSLENALLGSTAPAPVITGDPTQFQVQSNVLAQDLTVTSFNSWLGTADPGTAFGAAFAGEFGNRGAFPLIINGNGTQFSISQLSFTATSSDAADVLGFSFDPGDYDYGAGYVGIHFNGQPNNPSAWTFIDTPGDNTQLVDALVGRGSGNALWPCGPGDSSPCSTTSDQQAAIDAQAALLAGQTFTGTYTIGNISASGTFDVAAPEPSTFVLLGFSGVALFTARKRFIKPTAKS